jgi:histidine triad (HIT) family protein
VFRDDVTLAFLDHRPVFHGHVLLVPRRHIETLADLPDSLVEPLFTSARLLARGVQDAMNADGTFIAINNRVSQSVPHLHVHVVPRKRGDGLRGFMWPRTKYRDEKHVEEVRAAIEKAVRSMRQA